MQCRKRWSNLAGDYKKIKEWERAAAASREPSFWAMRNDARRERRLPGFFDREVYDILEGRGRAILEDRSARNAAAEEPPAVCVEEGKEAEVPEAVFDSGRPATEEALFSEDEEEEEEDAPAVAPPPPPPPVIAVPVSGELLVDFGFAFLLPLPPGACLHCLMCFRVLFIIFWCYI